MKKKLILLPLMLLSLSACGNQKIISSEKDRTFTKAHIKSLNKCLAIKTYAEYGYARTKLTLEDDTIISLSPNEYILINGKCPICESEQ